MKETQIKFLIESLRQAVEPLREEIIKSYEEEYCPVDLINGLKEIDKLEEQHDQVPLWQLLDMASCLVIDNGGKDENC